MTTRNAEPGTRNKPNGNHGKPYDLRDRTRQFALRVIRLCESLPRSGAAAVIGRQLLRSGTSVGANYRAAKRARSHPEFLSRMGVVEEEIDESLYWMELLVQSGVTRKEALGPLMQEANELAAIMVASIRTARKRSG
jgi:four helix bundle protein